MNAGTKISIIFILALLWGIWGIDLVGLLPWTEKVWWQIDLATTLWVAPWLILITWWAL